MKRNPQTAKEGVALIAVVGILGILVILAVTFAVTMRTERLAAEAGIADGATRQLVLGAVHAAVGEVNDILVNEDPVSGATAGAGVPRPLSTYASKSRRVLTSFINAANPDRVGAGAGLLTGVAAKWIPNRFFDDPDPDYDGPDLAADAQWIYVTDPNNDNRVIGRHAWAAFDCSGLYDANLIGVNPNGRQRGQNINEVYLGDLKGVLSVENFDDNRDAVRHFTTLPELLDLNSAANSSNGLDALSVGTADDLMPYSWTYDGGWFDWSATPPRWVLPGAIANANDAINALQPLYGSLASWPDMQNAVRDYFDADFVPVGGAGVFCGENIPMINEVDIASSVASAGAAGSITATHTIRIQVEIWYPFPGVANGQSYTVELGNPAGAPSITVVSVQPTNTFSFVPTIAPAPVAITANPATPFQTVTFLWATAPLGPMAALPTQLGVLMRNVPVTIRDSGGNVVDSALLQSGQLLIPPGAPSAAFRPSTFSSQVNDPRLNHVDSQWAQATRTPNALNAGVPNFDVSQAYLPARRPEGTAFFVRNGPMQSVDEFGFIGTGQAWTSVDLFAPAGRTLLERYRAGVNPLAIYTNHANLPANRAWSSGKLNPATASETALAAAFKDCPIQRGSPDTLAGALKITSSAISNLVESIVDYGFDETRYGSNGMYSPVGWVASAILTNDSSAAQLPDPGDPTKKMSNSDKDSLIRNTYRLFSPGQHLYTVVAIAQTIQDNDAVGYDAGADAVTGEKRAVALVWRDPFPDVNGRYISLIRAFQYLDE